MRQSLLLLALLLAIPGIGQEEIGNYFALSSNRTFAPGEKANIQMWAEGVKALDFRLYRVDKPGEFLSQLNDSHSFGNQTTELPKDSTLLSRFYRWKHRLHTQARVYVRDQFTPEARYALNEKLNPAPNEDARNARKKEKGTSYAAIPILNEKLLLKTWKEAVSSKERWNEQLVDVPVKEPGLYLVEATNGKLRAYTLLSVSAMTVLTKTQPGASLVRVVDRISGRSLPNVDVEFRTHAQLQSTAKTDANGFAKFTGEGASDVFVVASSGKDVAFDAVSEYSLGRDPERRTMGYLYTDRPIYRPGHKVFFKAVLRQPAAFGYDLPKFSEMNAEITDGEGKAIFRKTLSVSSFGTVRGEFELPITAALGYYGIKLTSGKSDTYGGFNVEEYKKPEYEVKIKPSKPRVVQGETVEAVINARYFFGEPVKDAKVKYTVRKAPYWPPWYESADSDFEQTENDESGGEYFSGEQGDEKEAKLNADGELRIKLPTPVANRDYLYRIEARVMDEGNREVPGYGLVIATHGSYRVDVRSDKYVVEPGANGSFTVSLKDYDSKPIQGDFRVAMTQWREKDKTLATTSGRTGADGTAKFSLPFANSGSYLVTVTSRTPEGRDVSDTAWVWVSGAGALYGNDNEQIKIITDKKKYSPGDVAKVLILTQHPDTDLWVTTEGRTVIDSRAVKAREAGGVSVEIPIKSEYQPKVFVSVSYLKEGKLFTGQATLKVPPVEKELQLTVVPSKNEYKPGEPARFDITAKDSKGQPVKAEMSVGVVDEALYAVQKDMLQTPLSYFYGNFYNEVNSSNSLSYYFRGEAGQKAMRLARIKPSLGQLKPDRVGDPRVRKAFPDTAFWMADLVTDSSGKGKVEFAFPDALTMWRTTTRAFTQDTKVGFNLNRVIVRKNLMTRMVNPRFLMEGDEVSLGVIVQNYLTSAKDAKVSLTGTNLEFLDGNEKTVNVEAKGSRKVEFRVLVKSGVESVLTTKAITNEESDALEITLPIKSYGTLLSNGASGALTGKQSAKVNLTAPGNNRSLEIRVAPTLAGSIFGALEYLSTFPYGCTEQTMSSFLPNVIVSDALKQLNIKSSLKQEDLFKKVNAGLERLYDYQHESGAWGWWKNDDDHPFMTAHVVAGLKEAKAAGYSVDEDRLRRGEQWLRKEFRRQADAQADLRAYIAYALGGKEDIETAFGLRPKLTSYGLAFLGLALDKLNDPRAVEIAQALESVAKQNDSEAWWPSTRDPLLDFNTDSSPETTSYALKLIARRRAGSPLLPKAAAWLVAHKDQGAWWSSTKQTAMVVYGLIDYLKSSGELKPNITVNVRVNGKEVLTKEFTEADAMAITPNVITVPANDGNDVEVKVSGTGRVYWNAQAKYYVNIEGRKPTEGGPITASREYFRLVPRESSGTTTYSLEALSGDIKPGDSIAVLLNVSARDWNYLLIEEPIPAGMELVTNDNTINLSGRPVWWRYSWTQREYRDDRVAFFRTHMYGDEQYFYVLKAVNPGKFRIPPTRVQPMYQPQQVATGKAATLEVKP